MPDTLVDQIKHAWNAFTDRDRNYQVPYDIGPGYSYAPNRTRLTLGTEQSIANALYNRISIDVAAVTVKHIREDEDERYVETINSGLNNCLTLEANVDQSGAAFIQDAAMSMFDEGVVALVPVDTSLNPKITGSFDILSMRTGKVVEWYPRHVRINIYNDRSGKREDVLLPKDTVAIVENPLYSVMNEPNSTLQRLVAKLNLLDAIDTQSGSGKIDVIMQFPFTVRSAKRQAEAEARRAAIETQLQDSKYGVAWIDATERITQLNRPMDNNLMTQIEYLTSMLYSQLGVTTAIFDGTADEQAINNYFNRTIGPVLKALTDGMKRRFLTKTARSQGQTIKYFRNPFLLVPVKEIAGIADSFTRNEILTPNEIRDIVGYKPSKEQGSDQLRNRNLNEAKPTDTGEEQKPPDNQEKGVLNEG